MSTIYMTILVSGLRFRLFRLCIHRPPLLPPTTLASQTCAHYSAPLPTTIVETPVMTEIPPAACSPKKKALLIGIRGKKRKGQLKGSHNDAKAIYDLLIDLYGYTPDQITMLLDDGNPNNTRPTRKNILRAIRDLVKGAKPGDWFFFYFAGHADQDKENNNPDEEDGKDEQISCCDERWIKDDVLKKLLVDAIPAGCTLRAVIDACHSGSLLDLDHYACNRIYVPWQSKGVRKARTLQNWMVKQNAILIPRRQTPPRSTPRSSNDNPFRSIANTLATLVGAQPSVVERTRLSHLNTSGLTIVTEGFTQSPVEETSSPVPRFCDGQHCLKLDVTPELLSSRADVLCLSSSRDEQLTWEDENGRSMTQILVELLRTEPNPNLYQVMEHISYQIYAYYHHVLHPTARQYKKNQYAARIQKEAQPPANTGSSSVHSSGDGFPDPRKPPGSVDSLPLETANFQDPELSSHFPITPKNMRTRLWDM